MEGEFDRECEEFGGCGGNSLPTIGTQWGLVRVQMASGMPKDKQEKELKEIDKTWQTLQLQGHVPSDDTRRKLLALLTRAEVQAKKAVEAHREDEKKSWIAARKWKKGMEEKEEYSRILHNMTLACAAVQLGQEQKQKLKADRRDRRSDKNLTSPDLTRQTAPLYPHLPTIEPPSYPVVQAPALEITSGIVNVREVEDGTLQRVKGCVTVARQEEIGKRERAIEEVEERSQEQEAGPSTGHHPSLSVPTLTHSAPAPVRSTYQASGTTGKVKPPPNGENDPFQYRVDRETQFCPLDPREEEQGDCDSVRDSSSMGDEWQLNRGDIYAAEMRGTLTVHAAPPRILKMTKPEEGERRQGSRSPYDLRSGHLMAPLIQKGPGKMLVYQPFSFTDMNCILEKMPSPAEGGGIWMSKFCQLTSGQTLALGDWRALIGRQLAAWERHQIEIAANTQDMPNSHQFEPFATAIGNAMRARFPTPHRAMHTLTFTLKDDEALPEFLLKCKNMWSDVAGCHPGSSPLQTVLFRKAVMAGMPKSVQKAMEDNPDIPGCDSDMWEKHLSHHVRDHKRKAQEANDEHASAQSQLLRRLQLDEARRKMSDTKKTQKPNAQLVQQPAMTPPVQQQQPAPVAQNPPYNTNWQTPQPFWGGPRYNRGGMRGRGRGRGALMTGCGGACYACGQQGHWHRDCPHYPPPQPPYPAQPPIQPPMQNIAPPAHYAPNGAAAPPQGQYPLTGREQDAWY